MIKRRSSAYGSNLRVSSGKGGLWPKSIKWILLVAVAMIVLSVGIAFAKWIIENKNNNNKVKLDDQLCGEVIKAHVVFIVDVTDPWPDASVRAFWQEFDRRQNGLEVGDRLSIFLIQSKTAEQNAEVIELFSKCRPRDGSHANFIYENPAKIKKRFREQFFEPLQRASKAIDFKQKARTSPILEAIYIVAKHPDFLRAERREIILFSDMLENDRICHYDSPLTEFEKVLKKSLRLLDVKGMLGDEAVVTVFQIPDRRHTEDHKKWWNDYFFYTCASIEFKLL